MSVAELLEGVSDFGREAVFQKLAHFDGTDFDPRKSERRGWLSADSREQPGVRQLVMADADVKEAEVAKHVFGLFDHFELFGRDPFTVWDTRTEASHLRLLGSRQAKARRQLADIVLGEAGLFQRSPHLKLGSRLRARAIIAHITGVFPVGDDREALRFGERCEFGEQFVFAEIATID